MTSNNCCYAQGTCWFDNCSSYMIFMSAKLNSGALLQAWRHHGIKRAAIVRAACVTHGACSRTLAPLCLRALPSRSATPTPIPGMCLPGQICQTRGMTPPGRAHSHSSFQCAHQRAFTMHMAKSCKHSLAPSLALHVEFESETLHAIDVSYTTCWYPHAGSSKFPYAQRAQRGGLRTSCRHWLRVMQ